jgi:hypothetical protein
MLAPHFPVATSRWQAALLHTMPSVHCRRERARAPVGTSRYPRLLPSITASAVPTVGIHNPLSADLHAGAARVHIPVLSLRTRARAACPAACGAAPGGAAAKLER